MATAEVDVVYEGLGRAVRWAVDLKLGFDLKPQGPSGHPLARVSGPRPAVQAWLVALSYDEDSVLWT